MFYRMHVRRYNPEMFTFELSVLILPTVGHFAQGEAIRETEKKLRGAYLLLAVFAEFTPQGIKMNEYRRLAITNMSFHNR